MRSVSISPGEYYHIFNRGNHKQEIFLDDKDRTRFLFMILHFQSPTTFDHLPNFISNYTRHSVFNISTKLKQKVINDRYVHLVNFTLMPNHFHLTLYELKENGITTYMQRILNGYTKYFNTKHGKSGHLFQGPYRAVHVASNTQLLHLSAYIHRNPTDLRKWHKKIDSYPWSSYQDYINENRWADLLQSNIITEQFTSKKEYMKFVKSSTAKRTEEALSEDVLIDSN
jgi:putative transposase